MPRRKAGGGSHGDTWNQRPACCQGAQSLPRLTSVPVGILARFSETSLLTVRARACWQPCGHGMPDVIPAGGRAPLLLLFHVERSWGWTVLKSAWMTCPYLGRHRLALASRVGCHGRPSCGQVHTPGPVVSLSKKMTACLKHTVLWAVTVRQGDVCQKKGCACYLQKKGKRIF